MRRLWKYRITDILDSIKKIQNYVDQMEFDDFQKDEKTIDAVIRNFIVIGEAARNISDGISAKYLNRTRSFRKLLTAIRKSMEKMPQISDSTKI